MKTRPISRKAQRDHGPISANRIEYVDNKSPVDLVIDFSVPEFAHLCPITSQPDVASMHVRFIPTDRLLETRSFHQYLWSFRNKKLFHEAVVPEVLGALTHVLGPKWCQVMGIFNVRGTSKERVIATHDELETSGVVRALSDRYAFRL